jgi:hypothetical protein
MQAFRQIARQPVSWSGIWYNTDGSTPVPGSGTAKYHTARFTILNTTTAKAVGMWGSANQPVSYRSGSGYLPSSVITESYVLTSASAISRGGGLGCRAEMSVAIFVPWVGFRNRIAKLEEKL